jgi:hypothetical protein
MLSSTFQSSISSEIELILLCSRPEINPQIATRVRDLVQTGIDWDSLAEKAHSWSVLPLFSRGFQAIGTHIIPEDKWDHIQALNFATLHRNLLLTRELISLLDNFASHDIPAIPYKGPVLAQSLYGNLALRPFLDLDVITRKNDADRARDIILSRGYKLTWPEIELTASQHSAHLDAKYNYQFARDVDRISVELHWTVTPKYFSFPPDPDWLWQRLEPLAFGGISMPTFPPEDYLLILCAHGANHCWLYRLSMICDLAELLHRHRNLDWDYILSQARSFGVTRILLLGLLLPHELLGSELPAEVRSQINADPMIRSLAGKTIHHFAQTDGGELSAFYIPRYHVNLRERIRDKARYAIFMSEPTVKDWSTLPLPASLAFFYYLMRPIRLAVEHGWTPMTQRLHHIL